MSGESVSSGSSAQTRMYPMSVATFGERDFVLPELDVGFGADFESEQEAKRTMKRMNTVKFEIETEKKLFTDLDTIANAPVESFSKSKGFTDREHILKRQKGRHEGEAELRLLKHVISRRPGDLREKMEVLEQLVNGTYEGDPDDHKESTIDHPALGSVHEKLEDIRQENTEHWCEKRGKVMREKYTNKEKRMLRRWFQQLDNDGSGEVNVEELQDPMLSSGILKTREQIVRVLANVDKNNTMGIDFEEFLLALSANKLADQSKLRRLQEMSADPIFDVDTLLTAERRDKLIISILRQSEQRQVDLDRVYKKYDRARMSRREYEQFAVEVEKTEEEQTHSQYLHMKYVHALDGVIQEKQQQFQQTLQQRESLYASEVYHMDATTLHHAFSDIRMSSSSRKEAIDRVKAVVPELDVSVSTSGVTLARGPLNAQQLGVAPPLVGGVTSAVMELGTSYAAALQQSCEEMTLTQEMKEVEKYRENPFHLYAPLSETRKHKLRKRLRQQGMVMERDGSLSSGSMTSSSFSLPTATPMTSTLQHSHSHGHSHHSPTHTRTGHTGGVSLPPVRTPESSRLVRGGIASLTPSSSSAKTPASGVKSGKKLMFGR